MSNKLKVLFAAPVDPFCRENGSSLITADLLDALLALDDVEIFSIFVRRPPPGYPRVAPHQLRSVLLDIPGLPRWRSVVSGFARGSSPLRHRFDNRLVAQRFLEAIGAEGFVPDLVHVEHLPLVDIGLAVGRRLSIPVVYRAHNVESRLWARRLGAPSFIKGPVIRAMDRREADAVQAVDLTLCISNGDLEWARERAPQARTALLPCTLNLSRYANVAPLPRVFERQVCFVGGLDWAPNEDGLRWFIDSVLPRIVEQLPSAGLAVLARGAAERAWIRDHDAVRVVDPESPAGRLFAGSDVSVAPLFQGGGVRIKIPESLAAGCPVVATRVGAEGHDLPGLAQVDEPAGFAEACLRYLRGDGPWAQRDGRRDALHAVYSADARASDLLRMWCETAEPLRLP